MCQAFSCLITKRKKVYWKAGVDSHDTLQSMYVKKDKDLKDDKDAPHNTFARIEVNPANGNYLQPDTWVYNIDERVKPDWLNDSHEKLAMKACNQWKKKLYTFNVKEAIKPIHPFLLTPPAKITRKHILALKEWDSVRDSVWGSVWGSVRDSVRAYIGSLFPNIKKWKYVNNRKSPFQKIKGYPFQSAVKLWKQGLVPSFDGLNWRLHAHKDARVVFKITKEKLMKYT